MNSTNVCRPWSNAKLCSTQTCPNEIVDVCRKTMENGGYQSPWSQDNPLFRSQTVHESWYRQLHQLSSPGVFKTCSVWNLRTRSGLEVAVRCACRHVKIREHSRRARGIQVRERVWCCGCSHGHAWSTCGVPVTLAVLSYRLTSLAFLMSSGPVSENNWKTCLFL